MLLPDRPPSRLKKALARRECFEYRLPTSLVSPIGKAFEQPLDFEGLVMLQSQEKYFHVQVYAETWNSDFERKPLVSN